MRRRKKSSFSGENMFKTATQEASHEDNASNIASRCDFLHNIGVSISNNNNLPNNNNTKTGRNKTDVITGS
jgi:hypothetical protein